MKSSPFLKVNVSEKEKALVDAKAKAAGMSTSAFIKSHITDLLGYEEDEYLPPFEYDGAERNNEIHVNLSDAELQAIQQFTKGQTYSSYLRRIGTNGPRVIHVDVYDEDIVDLEHRITPKIESMFGVIYALKMQKQLHDNQFERIEKLLTEILAELRKVIRSTRKEREALRKSRIRELRKRCDYAIKNETDCTAHLDRYEDE